MTHHKNFTKIYIYVLPNLLQNNLDSIYSKCGGYYVHGYIFEFTDREFVSRKKHQRKQFCETEKR